MRAEALAHRWVALLGAMLLFSGCVTLGPRQGTWRDTAAPALPLQAPSPLASTPSGESPLFVEPGEQARPHRRRIARGPGPAATRVNSGEALGQRMARAGPPRQEPPSCGGRAVPAGWPDFSSRDSEALLAPFFTCAAPAEFLALQERVDMPRLVEVLDEWRAVRLGSLGPVREDAASLLNRKRASFIVKATEDYGAAPAEVFVRFLADSSFDDDLREVFFRLSQDKRLETTLGLMPRARAELEARSLKLSVRPDRDFEAGDLLRGAGSALDLMASPERKNTLYARYAAQRRHLPLPYQEDLDEVERAAAEQHFSPGNVALGSFDHLTFGVPLGFYYLGVGTAQGMESLSRGKYEQAARELTPAVLLVALYVGGKGAHSLVGERGAPGVRLSMESRLRALQETARQLQGLMGVGGLGELARYIQASREAGRFVAVGGGDAALALHATGGDVARARPLMSRARPGATGSPPLKPGMGAATGRAIAALVDEGVGHTREVVEAKLAAAELEATGPRLPKDAKVLKQHQPSLDAVPPEAQGNPRWREYVEYYNERFNEVNEGTAAEGPLKWAPYEQMRGWFARGLAFERDMVGRLTADAEKPRAQRRFLGGFDTPRIETQVGVRKPGTGLRYADVLVIEEGSPGTGPRRVETFSFKSRDLSRLGDKALEAQLRADASEALRHYGERLDIRRSSVQSLLLGDSEVQVMRVRLLYEGGGLKPAGVNNLKAVVDAVREAVPGVEVLFP